MLLQGSTKARGNVGGACERWFFFFLRPSVVTMRIRRRWWCIRSTNPANKQ